MNKKNSFFLIKNAFPRADIIDLGNRMYSEFKRLNFDKENLEDSLQISLNRNEMPADNAKAKFRLDLKNYFHLTNSEILRSALYDILGDYVWHFPAMFRVMDPLKTSGLLPYHQDYTYNRHYPSLLTCFIPLSDCGVDAPSLTIIDKEIYNKYPHKSSGFWEFGISSENLSSDITDKEVNIVANAGDVVIFNDLTLHKSYVKKGMNKIRLSMDARAISIINISESIKKERRFIKSDESKIISLI